MKETEFKINKKKRNIIIAVIVAILIIAGIITGIVIFNINNKPVETGEPTTETIVVEEPTEEPTEEPKGTKEPTEEVKPTEEPAPSEEPTHTHTWSQATCTSPKTCSGCGETSGSALGHSFSNGKCSRCGAKDPNYQEPTPPVHTHSWSPATCTTPKTCTTCGETEGSALGHDYHEHTNYIQHPYEFIPGAKCSDCGLIGTIDEIVAHQDSGNHRGWDGVEIITQEEWEEEIHYWECSRCGASR